MRKWDKCCQKNSRSGQFFKAKKKYTLRPDNKEKWERGKYKKSNQKRHGQRKYKLIYWSVHALIVGSVIPLSEALRNILLPLSRESVGTCLSHTDNGGASCAVGDGGWATKTRDVVSGSEHEDLAFGGVGGVICCGIPRTRRSGAMTPRLMGVRLYDTFSRRSSETTRILGGMFQELSPIG